MLRGLVLPLLASLASTGCIGKLFEDVPPPVPDGYPQLDTSEEGRAELVIDGESYVTEFDGGTTYNIKGGFEDQLRGDTSFDYDFYLDYREVEVGEYTVAAGDLEVRYMSLESSTTCGPSSLTIVGKERWNDGLYGERDVIWGVVSVRVCGTAYDVSVGSEVAVQRELTGRFASVVTET